MATRPIRNPRTMGNTLKVEWAENFSPGRDGCKASCRIQIMRPIFGAGPFNKPIIAGLEPRYKNVRFLSFMPRGFQTVPLTTLDKVIKQTRGLPPNYWQRDMSHIQNAEDLLKHMKALIRTFF